MNIINKCEIRGERARENAITKFRHESIRLKIFNIRDCESVGKERCSVVTGLGECIYPDSPFLNNH